MCSRCTAALFTLDHYLFPGTYPGMDFRGICANLWTIVCMLLAAYPWVYVCYRKQSAWRAAAHLPQRSLNGARTTGSPQHKYGQLSRGNSPNFSNQHKSTQGRVWEKGVGGGGWGVASKPGIKGRPLNSKHYLPSLWLTGTHSVKIGRAAS